MQQLPRHARTRDQVRQGHHADKRLSVSDRELATTGLGDAGEKRAGRQVGRNRTVRPNTFDPVVASTARELLNKSDNERSGVLSTAMSFLGLYRDPVVAQVTRQCDWRIADLISDERAATLFLVVPPSDISRTKPLICLVLNQIGRRLTEDLQIRTADSAFC